MVNVKNKGQYPFQDTDSMQVFQPQAATEVTQLTGWLESQISAGAFEIVEAEAEAEAKAYPAKKK